MKVFQEEEWLIREKLVRFVCRSFSRTRSVKGLPNNLFFKFIFLL